MKHFRTIVTLTVLSLSTSIGGSALAAGYPWRDHAPPFNFRFGNNFDMHQQSRQLGTGELEGYQYIEFTGGFTVEGVPIAMHGQATVGWIMNGTPGKATVCTLDMHPTWLVDPGDLPRQPGYVHFHWVGSLAEAIRGQAFDGFFLKHTALDMFFFPEHGALVTPGIDYNFQPNIVTSCP